MTGRVSVIAAPHFDPGQRRITLEFPEGLTITEMVQAALPCQPTTELSQVRVALVTAHGSQVILPHRWAKVRPKAGVRVVIRLVAGKNALKSVLSIVVAVAAIATGTWFAGSLLGLTVGTTAYALAFAGASLAVTALGQLLINALIPPVKADDRSVANRYAISGLRNRLDPNGAVPVLLGSLRYAPPYAALPYTEIVDGFQYIRALFTLGEGPVNIADIRIGDTAISDYTNVDIELRQGAAGEPGIGLFPYQTAEETVGVELTRPLPRDALGEVITGAATVDVPIVRTTGADATHASVINLLPAGLIEYNDNGKAQGRVVSVRIEQRRVDAEAWDSVIQLDIWGKQQEPFYRQQTWVFPSRGRWQVRLTMLTDETTSTQIQQRTSWAALQTIRPEYPLAYPRPMTLVAVRIKATYQLSGALDNLSVLGSRVCPDFDQTTGLWVMRVTSNPASLFRYVLQSPANPKAVSDAGLDLALLEDWHGFCHSHGLAFNKVFDDTGTSLRDVLTQIAAVGRATPRHDGARWGVTIDRAQDLIIDHLDPQNSAGFSSTRSYIDHPHAFRVKFADETNDFKAAERVVRWPGYAGDITVTEALEMPGITSPDLIWREARRRQYEAIWRSDSYRVTQPGPVRVATRGDRVVLNHYVLDAVQASARVRDVIGTLSGAGPMPQVGDAVLFGRASAESLPLIVRGVERAQDNDEILHLVDEAAIIDALLYTDSVPCWTGRVGAELAASLPAANGGGSLTAYSSGDLVILRARAASATGVWSAWTESITLTIGTGDAAIPAALDDNAITVSTLLGGALIQLATGADTNTARVQIYRSTSVILNRAEDAIGEPLSVSPMQSYSTALGDTTRSNLIGNGSMSSGSGWTLGAGWTIAGGVANHAAGAAGTLSRAIGTTIGKWYRVGFTVTGRSGGTVTPRLSGGTVISGASVTSNGGQRDRIQATTGNDTLGLLASTSFDGAIDDVVAYLETAACLPQGNHYVWIEPQNTDGLPGPVAGPFLISIL